MTALVAAVFVASLVGSLHCAGMCGGLVAFYAGGAMGTGAAAGAGVTRGGGTARGGWAAHAAYSLGRLIVYAAIGALAGTLGAALDGIGGTLVGVQRVAAVVAGLFIAPGGSTPCCSRWGSRCRGCRCRPRSRSRWRAGSARSPGSRRRCAGWSSGC